MQRLEVSGATPIWVVSRQTASKFGVHLDGGTCKKRWKDDTLRNPPAKVSRGQMKRDGTCAETRFRLSGETDESI